MAIALIVSSQLSFWFLGSASCRGSFGDVRRSWTISAALGGLLLIAALGVVVRARLRGEPGLVIAGYALCISSMLVLMAWFFLLSMSFMR
jgi:hypothetical protein